MIPKITWGASFANTITFGYPLDSPVGYSEPREGHETLELDSGVFDAWVKGHRQLLAGDVRWIPGTVTTDPAATGWDGTTGWRAFLEWARGMNLFRFYPDATKGDYHSCYLIEPMSGQPEAEGDGTRRLRLVIVDSTTNAFDGYTWKP